jgi:hypothetical protein
MAVGRAGEDMEHRIVNAVSVCRHQRPSAASRSCKARSSWTSCPLPWRQASNRRPISACHCGSSYLEVRRRYSASSKRSSIVRVSTARFNSDRPMMVVTTIQMDFSRTRKIFPEFPLPIGEAVAHPVSVLKSESSATSCDEARCQCSRASNPGRRCCRTISALSSHRRGHRQR